MSGNNESLEPMTEEDAKRELNWIEDLLNDLSGDDEYLRAILHNQRIQLMDMVTRLQGQPRTNPASGKDVDVRPVPDDLMVRSSDLPIGTLARANQKIQHADHGKAKVQVDGTVFYETVRASEDISRGDVVSVIAPGNIVQREDDVSTAGLADVGDDTFRYDGKLYEIPDVDTSDMDVHVSNQLYDDGDRTNVSSSLSPGEDKEFARIEVPPDEFLLLRYTNATAHDTVTYNYYIDDKFDRDPDLSGSVPWATPPDLYEVIPGGFKLAEDFVSLQIAETSGSNSYSTVQGTLIGVRVEV